MSFSRAGIKRFNDIKGCAPPVGAYDPREVDAHGAAIAFDKSDRFKTPKDVGSCHGTSINMSQLSNLSAISCDGVTPTKKLFTTSTPNLFAVEKKGKHFEKPVMPVDPAKLKQLEKEIKKLLQERAEQDRILVKREEEWKKLDAKYKNTLQEKNSLQTKTAALEKQLTDVQKGNDVLKNKISAAEGSLKKQENLQAEVNSLKLQIAVKEGEAIRLRQELETSVNELLDCLYLSLETANVLKDREDLAGDLADLRANNLGILEKLKLANLKVKILKEEVERVIEDASLKTLETAQKWETKYLALTEEKRLLQLAMDSLEENLKSSDTCRKSLQENRDALLTEVASLEETIQEMKSEKWDNDEEIRHLKGLLFAEEDGRKVESQSAFESSAEKAELQEKIDHLVECNDEMNKNIRLMTEKYQTLEVALLDEQNVYENHIQKLEAQLNLSKGDVDRLNIEVVELQQKNKEYITTMGEEKALTDKKLLGLEEKLATSCEAEAVKLAEIQELKENLRQLSSDICAYKEQIEDGNIREKEAHEKVQELEEKVSRLQTELTEIQGTVLAQKELEEKINETKRQYADLQEQHARYVDETSGNIADLQSRLVDHQEEKASLTEEIHTLKSQIDQLTLDVHDYEQALKDFDCFKSEANQKQGELQKSLDEAFSVKASLEEKCEALEGKLKELSVQEAILSREKVELSSEVDKVKGERNTLCQANLELHTKLAVSEEARDELHQGNQELEKDYEQVRRQRVRLEESCAELEDKLSCAEARCAEQADLAHQVSKLTGELETVENNCEQLEARLSDMTCEQEELTRANTRLQEELVRSIEVKQAISDKFVATDAKLMKTEKQVVELQAAKEALQEQMYAAQEEDLTKMMTKIEDLTTQLETLEKAKDSFQQAVQELQQQKLESCKQIRELESEISERNSKVETITTEKDKLREDFEILSERKKTVDLKCTEMEEKVNMAQKEKVNLETEKRILEAELATVQEEVEKLRLNFSEIEKKSSCSVEERERLIGEKEDLQEQLAQALKKCDELVKSQESLELTLMENVKMQEEMSQTIDHLEDSCELRVKGEQEKFKQMEEQYEEQVTVLREQLADCVPREEVEPLLDDAYGWKAKYEDLLAKVEPFMEQIDAYEVEKQALLGMKKDAQKEVEKLSRDYAKLLGHQNQKQKIKHILKLKDENNSLKIELNKTREQVSKSRRTIQRLEDKVRSLEGKRGKFDPSKAFQHSKENDPKTPPQKLALDSAGRSLASPLANRNGKFISPVQNGFGNKL
ncbi:hyaluronan mediated motility receptor-like [Liolophura sinensis]|uniref:hyaluronan mediated motility receptor-like n=1 Tax=Liolophura sinensis TaxID=3198878 RepID=UPI00315871E3